MEKNLINEIYIYIYIYISHIKHNIANQPYFNFFLISKKKQEKKTQIRNTPTPPKNAVGFWNITSEAPSCSSQPFTPFIYILLPESLPLRTNWWEEHFWFIHRNSVLMGVGWGNLRTVFPDPPCLQGPPMWVLLRQRLDLYQPRAKEPVVGTALVTDYFFSELLFPRPRLRKMKNNGGEVLGQFKAGASLHVTETNFSNSTQAVQKMTSWFWPFSHPDNGQDARQRHYWK